MRRQAWWLPALAFVVPLGAALWWGVAQALDASAWSRLLHDSQTAPALRLAVWVGIASTLITVGATAWTVSRLHGTRAWQRLHAALGPMLAVPHVAFAIGLGLLLMPSGLPARLIAPLAGWEAPPDVATVQDPWGLALIAGLVLKEVPFLLWNVAAQLHAVDVARQLQVAAAMGYAPPQAWSRVLWPQLLPRLALPLLAVWGYSLTVVDMALVLGPTRPPTLAVLAWQWLLDADAATNRQGAAAAVLLALVMGAVALVVALLWRASRPRRARGWTRGDRIAAGSASFSAGPRAVAALYVAVVAMLIFVSLAGVWTFPSVWPQHWSAAAWTTALGSVPTIAFTAALAGAAATSGLVLAVGWMEATPSHWDARAAVVVFAPLLVPGVLLSGGLYRLALQLELDGRFAGLWLAHSLCAAPYVLVALAPAYRGHDPRYVQTAQALGRRRLAALWQVKWPMLRAPLAAAFAVGFAVSVAQYLPTQFVGAGRHVTITTEALTLAAGGQRPLAAAFALLQGLLPAAMFALAWSAAAERR